ncbi:cupin domain-containing protein [Eudoraea sp.]|uniref:cupin domain-containing protein n=1 Tax=Eudoraea sp. TaxID=1979955 RepID=UPI003C75141E
MKSIKLKEKYKKFDTFWQPHQIAEVDDMQIIIAKIQGEFVWHAHTDEDELFQVIKGTMYMQFRDHTEVVKEGEIIVVPKGVEHCPSTRENEIVHILLFEKKSVKHTGAVHHPLTQKIYPKI